MVKDFFLFCLIGMSFLVLQSTLLAVDTDNPFRADLLFILMIFLGTMNRLGLGLLLSILLGLLVDLLSWGLPGFAMILYPLIFWVYFFIGTRTDISSAVFAVTAVLIFRILYGLLVYFFLSVFRDLELTRTQLILLFEQALFNMVVSIPLFIIFKIFFGKKPSLS
jgi:cell shape-determining protein MreD